MSRRSHNLTRQLPLLYCASTSTLSINADLLLARGNRKMRDRRLGWRVAATILTREQGNGETRRARGTFVLFNSASVTRGGTNNRPAEWDPRCESSRGRLDRVCCANKIAPPARVFSDVALSLSPSLSRSRSFSRNKSERANRCSSSVRYTVHDTA